MNYMAESYTEILWRPKKYCVRGE